MALLGSSFSAPGFLAGLFGRQPAVSQQPQLDTAQLLQLLGQSNRRSPFMPAGPSTITRPPAPPMAAGPTPQAAASIPLPPPPPILTQAGDQPNGNDLSGMLPTSATPAAATSPPDTGAGLSPFDHIGNFINDNPLSLLALGAGIMSGGIGKGVTGALPFMQLEAKDRQQKQTLASTYQALKASGVPDALAAAGALNPQILPMIAQDYLGGAKLQETGVDPLTGQKSFAEYRPGRGFTPVASPGQTQSGASPSLLANGVTQVDHNLTGNDYLGQFSPEVQAWVKSYMNGDVMPTGNPRQTGIASAGKMIAQKVGQDLGVPVSDALYSQRRQYRQQLGTNTPNSAGGQAKAFNQGIEHMDDLANTLVKLDNSSGFGIPKLAEGVNAIRQMTSTQQAAVSDKARQIGQTLSGEVGKLFSGSAGGGVHERELTRERFDTVKSPEQLAAALEGTLEMMRGGLHALEGRRDEVLGPNNDVKFVTADTEKRIANIESTIARLKGAQPAPSSTAPAGNLKAGRYMWSPDKGLVAQ